MHKLNLQSSGRGFEKKNKMKWLVVTVHVLISLVYFLLGWVGITNSCVSVIEGGCNVSNGVLISLIIFPISLILFFLSLRKERLKTYFYFLAVLNTFIIVDSLFGSGMF